LAVSIFGGFSCTMNCLSKQAALMITVCVLHPGTRSQYAYDVPVGQQPAVCPTTGCIGLQPCLLMCNAAVQRNQTIVSCLSRNIQGSEHASTFQAFARDRVRSGIQRFLRLCLKDRS
jgi:hypothetical protein